MTTTSITIDGPQAAILHAALAVAITDARATLKLKSAAPYKAAIQLQVSGYEAEQKRLAEAFPELTDEAADA